MQFMHDKFIEYYDPTIEDTYRKQYLVDGKAVMLDIRDTAGQEGFTSLTAQYMQFGQGFLVMYSVTDRTTFDEVENIINEIARVKSRDNTPLILVANKCDLEKERVVSMEQGKALADSLNLPFYETSALYRLNVNEVFTHLVRNIWKDMNIDPSQVKVPSTPRQCAIL
eukprot:c2720_g1_i1.p1 GENE.c2720_g1_i1~~c2720_g1_i1.p1  ORF type:complete len:168 (-),score=39.60 c2720_g1_i1:91-594(-)